MPRTAGPKSFPRLAGALSAVLLLAVPVPGKGDASLRAPLKVATGPNPVSVAAGDLNGDGRLDLAVANGSSRLTIILQGPGSREEWLEQPPLVAGNGNFFLRAEDLDGDGDHDLAVADPGSNAYILLSKGEGLFDPPRALTESRGARWVAAGDWNGDGKVDLATANFESFLYSLYRGSGDGAFTFLESVRAAGRPHTIESLDFDGDGRHDLMVGLQAVGLLPLRSTDGGGFDPRPLVTDLGCVRYIATGDFDRDRKGDLGSSCAGEGKASAGVSLGTGAYRTVLDVDYGSGDVSLAIADLNGDGFHDLAFTATPLTDLDVHPGKGDGTFERKLTFSSTGTAPFFLLAADLDRDGLSDLVSADSGSSSLTLFWGERGERFLQAGARIAGLGPAKALAIADLDGDRKPDLFFSRSDQPRIQVYLDPAGRPLTEPSLTLNTGDVFTTLVSVDLDSDGVPDLAGVNLSRGSALVALLDSTGSVRSERSFPAGLLPAAAVPGRLDADGAIDVAVPCTGSNHLALFFGKGGGELEEAVVLPTISRPRDLAVGDFDADGRSDLLVVASSRIALHFGGGGRTFGEPITVEEDEAKSLSELAAGDLSGDGLLDLAVGETRTSSVLVYRGRGGRAFSPPETLKAGGAPTSLLLADLDSDGFPDLTAVQASAASFSVFPGRTGERFPVRIDYRIAAGALGHQVADLDGDGGLDVVVFGAQSGLILPGNIPRDREGAFRRGDFNGDRALDLADPIGTLGRLFLGGEPAWCADAADANDDGELNLTDPIATLNRLFLGGAPLPPPGSEACGVDPTPDSLGTCPPGC